jgi:hypothetical protein
MEAVMSVRRVSLYFLLIFAFSALVACLPADEMMPNQRVAAWSEQNLVFVADGPMGRVQAFRTGNGAPVFAAQTDIAPRKWVFDLQVDRQRGELWVLGDDGVSVHAAQGLQLKKRIPLATQSVAALRVEADRVVLMDGSGQTLGQIELGTFVASWRAPEHRG